MAAIWLHRRDGAMAQLSRVYNRQSRLSLISSLRWTANVTRKDLSTRSSSTIPWQPKTTVIACYSPTNVSDESAVDQFYEHLKSSTENAPAHNLMVIAEDYNAKIGPEDVPFTYNQETNRNGEKLLDYAEEFQLSVANTKFMKPANKLWAFQLPTGQRSQVDYIFICNKWRNSIMNCEPGRIQRSRMMSTELSPVPYVWASGSPRSPLLTLWRKFTGNTCMLPLKSPQRSP